ncbi:hypothetical protein [uncultured Pontibacter sp.]|uniref:hypothetical protein n=1 Tax=uncultured Pontibacter sp. TaxID=453356 RepID=UPI00261C3AC7|nr:hypothetical protein [uncultured Pontibacter sp.]
METAIRNGLERRPKRAKSAEPFLADALPAMKEAIAERDAVVFDEKFRALTMSCNACHALEKVPFFTVNPPATRVSPIRSSD